MARTRGQTARGQHPGDDAGRLGAPDVLALRRRSDGRPAGGPLSLRLPESEPPEQRSPRVLEGTRQPAALRDVQGCRRRLRPGPPHAADAGQPAPVLPWVDVATGSLGQGLAIGLGMALAGKYLDKLPYRVWVLSGDSEMAEGSVWEAIEHQAFYRLGNLTCILDVNRLGQCGPTMLQGNTGAY